MNVANMLRAQYGFGDKVQKAQLDSILKGNTELVFGNTTNGKAQTVDENGKRIVHMNMDKNGDWKMGAIMLGHESYRDGIVSSTDAQLAETRAAVAGHTDMTLRMMGDNLYAASMAQLVGSNQNLQIDLLARSLGTDVFNSYVDGMYDSSADYWKLMEDGSLAYDGKKDLYDELGYLIYETKATGLQSGLEEILGIDNAYALMKQAGMTWDKTNEKWILKDGEIKITQDMKTKDGISYGEIYNSRELIDAMTGQKGTIKDLNPKTIYNKMVNNGTMDLRPEALNVPDAVYFAMGSSVYISYDQFKKQQYITGKLPQEGIDYSVGNPLTLGEDKSIITTTFGALSPSGKFLHYGIDYSLSIKDDASDKYIDNNDKKIYPLLINNETIFNSSETVLGGNTISAFTDITYNFKGQSYTETIRTRYEHFESFSINDGKVGGSTNMVLGKGGNTGSASNGAHLHLDVSTSKRSPWLDLLNNKNGYTYYYKQSSSDNVARYYYSPELFNNKYKWKVNNANVYVELY